MDKIIIKVPGMPVREVELAPGAYRIGRSSETDLQIDHPSISGSHCEINVNDGAISVKDTGSTNGTFLDDQPVQECRIVPGQILRMGEVEVHYPQPEPTPPAPRVARMAPARPLRRPKTFYQSIPGAFVYPFKRNGLLLLGSGTVVFGLIDYLLGFHFEGVTAVGRVVGVLFSVCLAGYIFLYLQSIITTTALGGDDMPAWPDYEGWWDSALGPYLRLVGLVAACGAPAFLFFIYGGKMGLWLLIPLLILGAFYAPMALLAVAMDDSLLGLNPKLVVPSILRVPVEYLVSCLLLAVLLTILGGLTVLSEVLQQQFVSKIAGTFLSLYFMVAAMRLLGLLYFTQKDRLGWRA